jgi:cobalamin biosynthesis protein CobT
LLIENEGQQDKYDSIDEISEGRTERRASRRINTVLSELLVHKYKVYNKDWNIILKDTETKEQFYRISQCQMQNHIASK